MFSRFHPALLLLTLASSLLSGCARAQPKAQAATDAAADVNKGADVIEVIFDKKPIERGLTFDREGVKPGTLQLAEGEVTGWAATSSIVPDRKQARSFRFKVTDPRFQNGKRPAVDIEITYFNPADISTETRVDTARGSQQIGSTRGKLKTWRVLRYRLDDAYFGARAYPDDTMGTSGYDLRINTSNNLWLKRVRIIGYQRTGDVNWSRLLNIQSARGATPGGVLAFKRGADQRINFELDNGAQIARPVRYEMRVAGYDNRVRFEKKGEISAVPGATQLPFALDTSSWALGPYDGNIAFFLGDSKEPVMTEEFKMGVISDAVLPKARAGDYLFGLDTANAYNDEIHDETTLAYYRLMGVDAIRDVFTKGDGRDVKAMGKGLEILGREGVQAAAMISPPKGTDPAKLAEATAEVEEMARLYAGRGAGKLYYWELGNEPDLTGFYPGTIPEYINTMVALRDAIKRGAGAQPTAVMNGGLSFAHAEGKARSAEFIAKVPLDKIDILAYHAHGPGIATERKGYLRSKAPVEARGATWNFIDTETGYSAENRNGLERQASTAVEKQIYAQSVGVPTIYFFRLYFGSRRFSLTENRVQPRPSVLSYRNMVERLRYQRFERVLDFDGQTGTNGVEAFLFAERDANAQPTGRKTLVIWSTEPAQLDLSVALDKAGQTVGAPQLFDLYGNASSPRLSGQVAGIRVGTEPVYLSWNSAGLAADVKVVQPLLTVQSPPPLLAGQTTPLTILARNPTDKPLRAQLVIEGAARLPIQVAPAMREVILAPGATQKIEIAATLGRTDAPLALPRWWKVFLDPDLSKLDYSQVPDQVAGAKAGQYVWAADNRLDFRALAGTLKEKRPAIAYATIDAAQATTLPVAASADYYMAWYLNGRKVYDTLQTGNQAGTLADHTFDLPLQKGRNVLAVLVLSGSGGWNVEFGGPRERALAQTNVAPDNLKITLRDGDKLLAEQQVPLELSAPIARIEAARANDDYPSWQTLEPAAILGEDEVTNFFFKEPDQSRWYGGASDLSAQIWLREDGANLHLFVAATDDQLSAAKAVGDLGESDSLSLVLRDDAGAKLLETMVGLVGAKAVSTDDKVKANVSRADGRTLYHVVMSKAVVGSKPFRLGLTLNDNDGGLLKQNLRWGGEAGVRVAAE